MTNPERNPEAAGTPGNLLPRQEAFSLAVAEGCSPLEAYKRAGYSQKASPKTQGEEASRLMRNPRIAARIREIRVPVAEAAGLTLDSHLADLLAIRNKATADGRYSAAVSAEATRGKAAGLHVDQVKHSGSIGTKAGPELRLFLSVGADTLLEAFAKGKQYAIDLERFVVEVAERMAAAGYSADARDNGKLSLSKEHCWADPMRHVPNAAT
jgi:phage terminase small subunit